MGLYVRCQMTIRELIEALQSASEAVGPDAVVHVYDALEDCPVVVSSVLSFTDEETKKPYVGIE